MNAVWRFALTWFSFLPLQRGLNIAGGCLLAIALALGIANVFGAQSLTVFASGGFGALLILLAPAFGAGAALRDFAARNSLRLLPHARTRVIAGSTLAITMTAVIATLPVLFTQMGDANLGKSNPVYQASVVEVFAIAWAFAAVACIATFIASASAPAAVLVLLVPVVLPPLNLAAEDRLPEHMGSLAVAVSAWLAFSAWFLLARSIRPTATFMPNPWKTPGTTSSPQSVRRESALVSREAAIRSYLFSTATPVKASLNTAGITLVMMLVLWMAVRNGGRAGLQISMLMVGYCAVMNAIMTGFITVQRARRLWLRAGMNRAQLFTIAERMGVAMTLLLISIVASGLAVWSLTQRPELAAQIMLNIPLQLALALCLFYAFMGYTGSLHPFSFALDIAVGIWALWVSLMPRPIASPLPQTLTLLLLTLALTLVLRLRAQRRWQGVVWRPMPQLNRSIR